MTPEQIYKLRKDLSMTADEFAASLRFKGKNKRGSVNRWERGIRKPSDQTITLMKELAQERGVTI